MTNKFNVGDKAVFNQDYGNYKINDEVTISYAGNELIGFTGKKGDGNCYPSRLEIIESNQNQRITKLEEEVAELKLIVAQIRKPSTVIEEALANDIIEFEGKQYKKVDREAQINDVVIFRVNETDKEFSVTNKPYAVTHMEDGSPMFMGNDRTEFHVYADSHNRTPETVDVYELIAEDKPKTANQLRAEIIEKAKGFVEISKNRRGHYEVEDNRSHIPWDCNVEFIVNEEKRTVVALMRGFMTNKIYARGIAKCMPGDVFNEHIGKAIALGRALGLDVGEFEQAVQPTEFAKGQIIKADHAPDLGNHEIIRIERNGAYFKTGSCEDFHYLNRAKEDRFHIINDTNAQYTSEVVE